MPNAVSYQLIESGLRNYIVKLTIVGDGSGEETALRVNEVSGDMGTAPSLRRVTGLLVGCTAQLLWDADTDVVVFGLSDSRDIDLTFPAAGIPNNAGTGKTGDLLITTAGLGNGDVVTLIVHLTKS